jgi:hypothetical protein
MGDLGFIGGSPNGIWPTSRGMTMLLRYRDGTEDDDRMFDLPIDQQREHVARAMGLGPNWVKDGGWERLIDTLLSVRRNDGKPSFYREIGRMLSPNLY